MSKRTFAPTGERILFDLGEDKIEVKTASGIIKSEEMLAEERAKVKSNQFYKVLGVGARCTEVVAGDEISLEGDYRTVTVEGKDYGLIREFNVDLVISNQ